ncbi:hypothetical protein [Roseimaritima ulvae]|uniref:DUF4878 domain-containing protein n=1 Tax=Roseimaritima ulvae TaxID=980254 RepID=A0A5B9QJF7_9BACT|nr:hypothetical protein [Roseimaritima ulvae]QEG39044.1 hypothetical protein UC8_10050 [Roseimaritima ulvae]
MNCQQLFSRPSMALSLFALSLVCFTGCGAGPAAESTLEQDAYATIEGLGDAAGDEAMFAESFVPGVAPKNRKDYAACGYEVVGDPQIQDDTATLDVKIFGGVHASGGSDSSRSTTSAKNSQQTWTLKRVGEEWKIETAPLG